MSQRVAIAARKRRRLITYAWVSAMALAIIVLIYKEQTALLYILATLGITVLLAVVALVDLHGNDGLAAAGEAPASPVANDSGGSTTARVSPATRRSR
jgi:hypothetical protein